MLMSRQVRLRLNKKQRIAFAQHAGCRLYAWNWALNRKKESYKKMGKSPSYVDLNKELVQLKKLPKGEEGSLFFFNDVSSCVSTQAFRDLDKSYAAAFRRLKKGENPGFPHFKAKRIGEGSFRLQGRLGQVAVKCGYIKLPTIGWVRISPGDRDYLAEGPHKSVNLVQEHGEWYASVFIDTVEKPEVAAGVLPEVGIDLGVRKLATSVDVDGIVTTEPNRKAQLRYARKLRKAQKTKDRRKKGSNRRKKAVRVIGRIHKRVNNIRKDAIHKFTSKVAVKYKVVAVENLKSKNMMRAKKGRGRKAKSSLNRSLADASFGEIIRQLDYKLKINGGRLVKVDPAYTSQRCSECGSFTNCGSKEQFTCASCNLVIDRDVNAARNILTLSRGEVDAASCTESLNARGEVVRHQSLRALAHASKKRELSSSSTT